MSKANKDGRYDPQEIEAAKIPVAQTISVTSTAAGVTATAPDWSAGEFVQIVAAAGVTGTLNIPNPTNPPTPGNSGRLYVEIKGLGTLGTLSWGTAYTVAATLPVKPGNAKSRIGEFVWNGASWVCVAAPAVDY
jgi:hypothetical protein